MDSEEVDSSGRVLDGDWLNVRETARLLDVHENTVRNWSKTGQLRDERVPGSRFLRFRRADVESLTAQRGRSRPSLREERTTVGPELVDAAQIARWADSADARRLFPELMRRLLAGTPGVSGIVVRVGEAIDWSGWDGEARASDAPFLPNGSLKFEFGTNKNVKAKADKDWNDRVGSASTDDVFVFVTPRRWPGAQGWASARRGEARYADVSVVDADTLEGWLKKTPSVHIWFSELLGRQPRHAFSLEGWWARFSSSTDPALPVEMFTAGRESQGNALREALSDTARCTTIRCEWVSDALGFVYGTLAVDDGATMPVVLVETHEVFASIAEEPAQVVLVPMFPDADVHKALVHGHHVVLVVDDTAAARRPDITLPRVDRSGTLDAFQRGGSDFRDADQFAGLARRNLQAFVRSISKDQRFAHPGWAGGEVAPLAARLCLAGRWTMSDADTALLVKFLGKSPDELDDLSASLSGADPVFRRVGRLWQLTSPREAFQLLAPTMVGRPRLMHQWVDLVFTSLSEADPVLDLPEDERQFAGLRDIHRELSPSLRSGLARGVVLVGVLGREPEFVTPDGVSLSDYAAQVVRGLVEAANADRTGRRWLELCDVMVYLAEAAPQVFLDAVLADLDQAQPTLLTLFDDGGSSQPTFGRTSPHTYLLWALETLCWSPAYMLDAVRALAALAALDPGGRTGNRPIGSLGTVLCGWVNHTSATHAQRIDVLRALRTVQPDVSWRLTLALWPSLHGFSMPPHYPYMSRWTPDETSVSLSEWAAFVHELVDVAFDLVDDDPVRIGKVSSRLGSAPEADQARILAKLADVAATATLDDEARFELWRELDSLVTKHERFPDAGWAFRPDQLQLIESAADHLRPAEDPRRFSYLFGWHPDIAGMDDSDFDAYESRLDDLRREAMTTLLAARDRMAGLERMTLDAPASGLVGAHLSQDPSISLKDMLPWLASDQDALRMAATVWVNNHAQSVNRIDWLRSKLATPALAGAARETFLRALPVEQAVWELVEGHEPDADFYWKYATPHGAKVGEDEALVTRLLDRHRAWAAVSVLASAAHRAAAQHTPAHPAPPTDLIVRTLFQAVGEEPRADEIKSLASYGVGELFDYLAEHGTDDSVMARLEFAFYRLLEHTRQPRALNHALATDPALFAEFVTLAYTGRNTKTPPRSEGEQRAARQASWVLHSWTGFPGQTSDGSVDAAILDNWLQDVRLRLSGSGHTDIGDELIGQTFAHAPKGTDGIWPPEAIRDAVDRIGSNELENGLVIGRFNSRGVTTRGAYEGGDQERKLAAQYRSWAASLKTSAQRMSRVLTAIAEDYERDAKREDIRADIDADSD